MKESCVDTGQCLLKQGVAGSSLKAKTAQQVGVEVYKGDEVTIAESRVELDSEKNEKNGEWDLDWTTTLESGVKNSIPEARKLLKQEVIMVGLGRLV